jgi:V8-like Glu-specific endopeptidase
MFALKAELCSLAMEGRFVNARENFSDRVHHLKDTMDMKFIVVAEKISYLVYDVERFFYRIPNECYRWLGSDLYTMLEICFLLAILVAGLVVVYSVGVGGSNLMRKLFPKKKLAAPTVEKGIKYVTKRKTCHGVEHEIVIDGKTIQIQEDETLTRMRQDEMSMPGSSLFPSKQKNVGAITVSADGEHVDIVGCFFRIDDYLVTAGHVANAVSSGVAMVCVCGMHNQRKELHFANIESSFEIDAEFFEMENNAITSHYDVFARKLSPKMWSHLGFGPVSTKRDSCYNQTVSACGFVGSEALFMTSSGKTIAKSGLEELWHTASTQKGFSGSPLFSGNSVVGMHVASQGDKNVAIRIELIKMLLETKHESNMPEISKNGKDFKFKGRSHVARELLEGGWGFEDSNGRVDIGWTRADVEDLMRIGENPRFTETLEDLLDPDTTPLTDRSYKKLLRYADESAEITVAKEVSVPITKSKAAPIVRESDAYVSMPTQAAVHCNKSPAVNTTALDYIEAKSEQLKKMGYDKEKYVYPVITSTTEEQSLRCHLELFNKRVKQVTRPPKEEEKDKVAFIVSEMMRHNKFEAPLGYRTREAVLAVIDSKAVKDSKSPGHPYQSAGMPTIEKVLQQYTKEGYSELVLREWEASEIELKTFIKAEPTKASKLAAQMARVVTGMPLHKTIKNNCVFANFNDVLVDNWRDSPVKFAFNPQRPGDIRHLADLFQGRSVVESDKSNWDYNYFEWLFEIVEKITLELVVQPADMDDAEFIQYQKDIRSCIEEVTKGSVYRCTNGKVFKTSESGAMKSGWLMTIAFNSIGQLALHVLALLRLGKTADEIMSDDYKIIVGGDDVLQTFPPEFDTNGYQSTLRELGFDVTDFKIHDGFEGCEYFSNQYTKNDGAWTYKPTRFTKHVAHLTHTKQEDLANALSCHMLNHVWDNSKFRFFETMFKEFKKKDPDNFPLVLLKTQQRLKNKVQGLECL